MGDGEQQGMKGTVTATIADWNFDLLPLELADLQAANYDL